MGLGMAYVHGLQILSHNGRLAADRGPLQPVPPGHRAGGQGRNRHPGAQLLPHTDPVHEVSIIPTSKGALGYTMQMPEEDQYLIGEAELKEKMAVILGGRAAELLVIGEASTGASNDLERATGLARRMVTEFGMTESLVPVRYQTSANSGYLGYQGTLRQDLSPETATLIDQETRRLVQEAQESALSLLTEHRATLDEIARILQKTEVIGGEEICQIVPECHGEKQVQV